MESAALHLSILYLQFNNSANQYEQLVHKCVNISNYEFAINFANLASQLINKTLLSLTRSVNEFKLINQALSGQRRSHNAFFLFPCELLRCLFKQPYII